LGANIAGRFAAYQSANGDGPEAGGSVDPIELYTRAILATRSEFSPFPNYLELDILDLLVFQKSLLDTENTARFRSAIEDVQTVLSMRPEDGVDRPALDSKTTTASIRQVYFGISSLRAKWKARALFAHNEHTITPGFDVYAAVSGLWDDVIVTLQAAEDIVADENLSASGVTFAANLQRESTAPAEPVPVRFTVSALGNPVAIQSISVMTAQGEEKLLDADPPIEIAAADTVYEFPYSYLATRAPELSIHPFVLSAEIRFADGTFARRHFRRGVYITRPVTFVVRFPNGTSLTQGTVPVDIDVTKHRAFDSLIHARWFSPVGLNPVEGPALEARMPAQTDQMTIRMNVLVPTPCRPGPYPFTLKVLSNGEEAGAVSASLFKHYQWLFAGPFAEKLESLDADYFPETTINLHHRYKGAYGQVTWRPLGTDSFADEGNVLLDGLLPSGSVGFLYTVIRTAAEQTTTVYFRSGSPARLFINGDPLIRVDAGDYNILKRARVELNEGLNDVMVKTLSADEPVLFFQLGDEEDLASVEFNNNLWELVDGYAELAQHSADHGEDGPPQTQRQVTLTYSNPEANSVSVMGTFNGWSPTNTNMRRNNSGNWEISLYLSPGRYAYRFLVNNSREVLDPDRADKEPDGYGGFNSVLYVE
jgi:hypothetical protein